MHLRSAEQKSSTVVSNNNRKIHVQIYKQLSCVLQRQAKTILLDRELQNTNCKATPKNLQCDI